MEARDPNFHLNVFDPTDLRDVNGAPYTYSYPPLSFMAGVTGLVGTTIFDARRLAAVIFLHERTSAAGHRRLVVVSMKDQAETFFPRAAIVPAGWFSTPKVAVPVGVVADYITQGRVPILNHDLKLNDRTVYDEHFNTPIRFRYFFGQPDPKDASHFTIKYELINGSEVQPGLIDGWLGDDEAIRMQAHGPWAAPGVIYTPTGKNIMDP